MEPGQALEAYRSNSSPVTDKENKNPNRFDRMDLRLQAIKNIAMTLQKNPYKPKVNILSDEESGMKTKPTRLDRIEAEIENLHLIFMQSFGNKYEQALKNLRRKNEIKKGLADVEHGLKNITSRIFKKEPPSRIGKWNRLDRIESHLRLLEGFSILHLQRQTIKNMANAKLNPSHRVWK